MAGSPVGILINARNLLGRYRWVPRPWKKCSNHIELGRKVKQCLREGHGLVLVICTISCHEADLGQGIFETDLLGGPSIANVGVESPIRALGDFGDHEAAGDVGHPVSVLWVSRSTTSRKYSFCVRELKTVRVRVQLLCIVQVSSGPAIDYDIVAVSDIITVRSVRCHCYSAQSKSVSYRALYREHRAGVLSDLHTETIKLLPS